ncbi:hypothetical protein [Microbispora rosea]
MVIALLVALISAVAAVIVIPEVRAGLGLSGDSAAPVQAHMVLEDPSKVKINQPVGISFFGFQPGELVRLSIDLGEVEFVEGGTSIRMNDKGEQGPVHIVFHGVPRPSAYPYQLNTNMVNLAATGLTSQRAAISDILVDLRRW